MTIDSTNIVAPIGVDAVLGEGERDALIDATVDLRQCLSEACGSDFPIAVRFFSRLSEIQPASLPRLVATSLLLEMTEPEDPLADVEKRLRESLSRIASDGYSKLFVCTVFRRIRRKNAVIDSGESRIERIRRLNLLAAQLSHELNINIIDFDRSFAHRGGRVLDVDFRLEGPAAVFTARHAILSTFFAAGLDDFCSPELQNKAKQLYEQRSRQISIPTQHDLNAGKMLFRVADSEKSDQTYALVPVRRTLADLWFNLKKGRTTPMETFQVVLRAVRRRVLAGRAGRRSNA
jgi:hypothetical protein